MPVVNQNTPVETIQVPVPTPARPKTKASTPAPAPVTQPMPSPRPSPINFGGEAINQTTGQLHGVSAVILPWSPQPTRMSRRPKRYGRAPDHELRPFVEQIGGFASNNHADLVLADKFDDYDDPRSIIVRRDMSYRQHPRGFVAGRAEHYNQMMPPGDRVREDGPVRRIDTGDTFQLEYVPQFYSGSDHDTDPPHGYAYYLDPDNRDDPSHVAYLTPEEHQRIMDEFGPKQMGRKNSIRRYDRVTLTPTQKVKARSVELVVLPNNIDGKKCGTCKYAKKHSAEGTGLYCTNNKVHMNVKENWGCKLWDARGVRKLSRKKYGRAPAEDVNGFVSGKNGQLGGVRNNNINDLILADKLDDYDDPRSLLIRRDVDYRANNPEWYDGMRNHQEELFGGYPVGIPHENGSYFTTIPTNDNLSWEFSTYQARENKNTIAYRHSLRNKNTGEILYSCYVTPEEHQQAIEKVQQYRRKRYARPIRAINPGETPHQALTRILGNRPFVRPGRTSMIYRNNNTGNIHVRLYGTDVVVAHPNGQVTLNHGGFKTLTTARFMSGYSGMPVSFAGGQFRVGLRHPDTGAYQWHDYENNTPFPIRTTTAGEDLYRSIDREPEEASNHGAYADWLDEQGRNEEARRHRIIHQALLDDPNRMSRRRKVLKYMRSNTENLLSVARGNPTERELHGRIADALDEDHPGTKVAELIRRQFAQGQYLGEEPPDNTFHYPHNGTGTVRNTHVNPAVQIGTDGPFRIWLRHAPTNRSHWWPVNDVPNMRWIVRAESTLPGSEGTGYSFEFPHERAHEIPRMFPEAERYISPENKEQYLHNHLNGGQYFVPRWQHRAIEANRFQDQLDATDH